MVAAIGAAPLGLVVAAKAAPLPGVVAAAFFGSECFWPSSTKAMAAALASSYNFSSGSDDAFLGNAR